MKSLSILGFSILFEVCALTCCVSGNLSDTASFQKQISVPGAGELGSDLQGVGVVQLPEQTFNFDVSSAFIDLNKVGTLSLTVPHNSLSNSDLSFISEVVVSIQPQNSSEPAINVSDYMVSPTPGTTIEMPVENLPTFLSYVSGGPCTIGITISVNPAKAPPNASTLDYTLDLGLDIKVSK